MPLPARPIAFVLAASNHGSMIVNRNDYRMVNPMSGYGVGYQILQYSGFDEQEVGLALALLRCRRKHFGDGVFALDGGANVGVHTIEWARHMHGWGEVLSFEAQEKVFYALAGNIALNNCLNARARFAALGAESGVLSVPKPNYFEPASFGSLEIKSRSNTEFIGQKISYASEDCDDVTMIAIDSLNLGRLDFLKLDIEGMELEVLSGARRTLERCQPIILVEVIKSDRAALSSCLLDLGYRLYPMGMNTLAVHQSDPTLRQMTLSDGRLILSI
jgi:FkbM family methyltransferase